MKKKKFSSKRPLTDAEEAEIQAMIASDPDNPELTAVQLKKAKPFAKVFPALAASIKRSRGRPRIENPKAAVTLRVHPDTLKRFKATGKDWRARMADALDSAKPSRKTG